MKNSPPSFPYLEKRRPSLSKIGVRKVKTTLLGEATGLLAAMDNNRKAVEALQASMPDLMRVRRDCWKLYKFVKLAWPHVPALNHVEFVPGWHIAYICENTSKRSRSAIS